MFLRDALERQKFCPFEYYTLSGDHNVFV